MTTVALLDRNVISWLDRRLEALAVVRQAIRGGRLRLIRTHILADELRPPDPGEAARLDALRRELQGEAVPTRGFAFDVSRLNQAQPFSEEDAALYDRLRVAQPDQPGRINNARDALLTVTAAREGAVLVSDDIYMVKRARAEGIEAVRPVEFVERLGQFGAP